MNEKLMEAANAVAKSSGTMTARYGAAMVSLFLELQRLSALPVEKQADLRLPSYGYRDQEMASSGALFVAARAAALECASARRATHKRVGPTVLALWTAAQEWAKATAQEWAKTTALESQAAKFRLQLAIAVEEIAKKAID